MRKIAPGAGLADFRPPAAPAAAAEPVGRSPAFRRLLRQIELVADSEATVLITGETGTGKELVARAVHERSARRAAPMIRVNCAGIPDTLFESEFFGSARGAFTGSVADKPGRFELAAGGTLFLDEIGEVPLGLQPKLLRAIQEREVERIGDGRPRRVDVRIIAATNCDLNAHVAAGRFRQDLYYRLNVFPLAVPPLRERREDIPLLAEHFLRRYAQLLGRPSPILAERAAQELAACSWPGNVRELQNVVERALILAQGGDVHFEIPSPPPIAPVSLGAAARATLLTRSDLRRLERESIIEALSRTGGKVSGSDGAAALLGMRPTTLHSRMLALDLAGRGSAVPEGHAEVPAETMGSRPEPALPYQRT